MTMETPLKNKDEIRAYFNRKLNVFRYTPDFGKDSAITKVRVADGLTCEVSEGDYKFTVDMSKRIGGSERGASPGTFGRTALGSCIAITYMMFASQMEIPIENLEVQLEAEFDNRGMYGVKDVRPGYSEIRYKVDIKSSAPKARIEEMAKRAEAACPYLDVFSTPQKLVRELKISKS